LSGTAIFSGERNENIFTPANFYHQLLLNSSTDFIYVNINKFFLTKHKLLMKRHYGNMTVQYQFPGVAFMYQAIN